MCKDGAYTNCTDGYSFKRQHQPDRHGYRPALGRGPADVLRQHGPDHLHADQYGRSWRRFSSGRDLDFNSVVPQGSGTFRGIVVADDVAPDPLRRPGPLPAARHDRRGDRADRRTVLEKPSSSGTGTTARPTSYRRSAKARSINTAPRRVPQRSFNNVVCSGNGGSTKRTERSGGKRRHHVHPAMVGFRRRQGQILRHFVSPRRESAVRTWSSASSGATAR